MTLVILHDIGIPKYMTRRFPHGQAGMHIERSDAITMRSKGSLPFDEKNTNFLIFPFPVSLSLSVLSSFSSSFFFLSGGHH